MLDDNQLATCVDIARTLATRVRYLTADYVMRGWYGVSNDCSQAGDAIAWLCERELVAQATIEVRTTAPAKRPLFAWRPSHPDPSWDEWDALAGRLADRWSQALTPIEIIYLGPRGAALFGVINHDLGRPCEWSHDFLTTEVYFHYLVNRPAEVSQWRGEAALPKWGYHISHMKDPDAMLVTADGTIERVIEIAGKYSASHLHDLHRHCAGEACNRLETWTRDHEATHMVNPYRNTEIGYELW